MSTRAADWTLPELATAVADRLDALGWIGDAPDARVSARPDARTVRYYQTKGLVDRPRIVKRKARYHARHLRQLVAIKALQSQGLALRAIQGRLSGLSNAALDAVAVEAVAVEAAAVEAAPRRAAPRRGRSSAARGASGVELRTVTRREAELAPGLALTIADLDPGSVDRAAVLARVEAVLDALGVPRAVARPARDAGVRT